MGKQVCRSLYTQSLPRSMTHTEKTEVGNLPSGLGVAQSQQEASACKLRLQLHETGLSIRCLDKAGSSQRQHTNELVIWPQPGKHTHRLLSKKLLSLLGQKWGLLPVKSGTTRMGSPTGASCVLTN